MGSFDQTKTEMTEKEIYTGHWKWIANGPPIKVPVYQTHHQVIDHKKMIY